PALQQPDTSDRHRWYGAMDPRQRLARRSGRCLPGAPALGVPDQHRAAAAQERYRVAGESYRRVLANAMQDALHGLGLVLLVVGLTWLLSVVLGRVVTRRGMAVWVWDRSGAIGRVLIVLGFGLAALGLAQGGSGSGGAELMVLGALLGMAGIWLILPGP